MKRKGLQLDVSSSGALAASLDKCIVRLVILIRSSGRFVLSTHRAGHLSCGDPLQKDQ